MARPALMIAMVGLLAAATVSAQELSAEAPAASDLTEMSLEQLMNIPVYAAARREQQSSEAASSVTVITAQEIRNHGWRTLAEIMNATPGLYMTDDRTYQYLGVRGFSRPGDDNTRILVLLNGARVNEPMFDSGGVGHDAIVDVGVIDRVEVVRGPSSSLYGTNAFLAVVNIITHTGAGAAGGRATATYGSYDTWHGLVSYGYHADSGLDAIVSASGAQSEGQDYHFPEFAAPETNNGFAEDVDQEKYSNIFARLSWRAFTYQFAFVDRTKDCPTASFGRIFNDPDSRDEDRKILNTLSYAPGVSEHFDIQTTLTHQYYAYDGYYPYDISDAQDGSLRIVNQDSVRSEWWGIDLKTSTTVVPRNRITAGAEYRDIYRMDQANVDAGVEDANFEDQRSSTVTGLYFEDEIKFATWANLVVGFRYDHIGLSGEERLSPRGGLILSPWRGGTLKLLGGQAFRSPNPSEMYYNDDGYTTKANPELGSETIHTYEAIVEQQLDDRWFGSVALYHYGIEDLISQTLDPDDGLLQYNNVDQVETDGGELSLHYQFSAAAMGALSYSYCDARDVTTGEWLTNSPRHLGKARLSGPLWGPELRGGVELLYEGERRTLGGNTTDAALVANVKVLRRNVIKNWDLSVAVSNLLDAQYGYPGGQEHVQDEIPADGRNYRLKAVFNF